jgi:hypothetical protein
VSDSRRRALTLFLPGLLGPRLREAAEALTEGLVLPALETLLSRGSHRVRQGSDETPEGMLFELFGHRRGRDADWPVAPVTRTLDAEAATPGWYVRADPVHLNADLREVRLFDASAFTLEEGEAQRLASEVRACLPAEGWVLEALHPARWYLRLPHAPRIRTHPPSAVIGANLDEFLPEGEDSPRWRRLLNEVQMVLHASAVNEARTARGELPVNSIWLWGAGDLPAAPTSPWGHVWSDDTLALGLARLAEAGYQALPASGAAWLAQSGPGDHLIADAGAHRCAQLGDVVRWRSFVAALEERWLQPLRAAVRRRELESLEIVAGRGLAYRATRWSLRRSWRRRKPLVAFMTGDAEGAQ